MLGIVCGVILLKLGMAALGLGQNARPGADRGDFVLASSALPIVIGEWTQTDFTPAKSSTDLSPGEYWWTHQWRYEADSADAVVSFDQADWIDWHDLTACYRMAGWNMKSRSIESSNDWPYVVAHYERPGVNATLVYSMFYDDGSPVSPAGFEATTTNQGALDNLRLRSENRNVRFSGRAFQCQAFAVSATQPVDHLLQLHLTSRSQIRDATASNR